MKLKQTKKQQKLNNLDWNQVFNENKISKSFAKRKEKRIVSDHNTSKNGLIPLKIAENFDQLFIKTLTKKGKKHNAIKIYNQLLKNLKKDNKKIHNVFYKNIYKLRPIFNTRRPRIIPTNIIRLRFAMDEIINLSKSHKNQNQMSDKLSKDIQTIFSRNQILYDRFKRNNATFKVERYQDKNKFKEFSLRRKA